MLTSYYHYHSTTLPLLPHHHPTTTTTTTTTTPATATTTTTTITTTTATTLVVLVLASTSTNTTTTTTKYLLAGCFGVVKKQRRGCSSCFHPLVETKEEYMLQLGCNFCLYLVVVVVAAAPFVLQSSLLQTFIAPCRSALLGVEFHGTTPGVLVRLPPPFWRRAVRVHGPDTGLRRSLQSLEERFSAAQARQTRSEMTAQQPWRRRWKWPLFWARKWHAAGFLEVSGFSIYSDYSVFDVIITYASAASRGIQQGPWAWQAQARQLEAILTEFNVEDHSFQGRMELY